jgi:hypothetical protein
VRVVPGSWSVVSGNQMEDGDDGYGVGHQRHAGDGEHERNGSMLGGESGILRVRSGLACGSFASVCLSVFRSRYSTCNLRGPVL